VCPTFDVGHGIVQELDILSHIIDAEPYLPATRSWGFGNPLDKSVIDNPTGMYDKIADLDKQNCTFQGFVVLKQLKP